VLAAAVEYRWTFEPAILMTVGLAGGAYLWRIRDLGRSRGGGAARRHDGLRTLAFMAGLVVILLALSSPVESLGEERLFSAHMAQHLLLADIAPVLLLLGLSRVLMRPAVRLLRPLEEALGPLAHPITALALLVGAMWTWHIPVMYELALHHPLAHALEHACFFWTGLAFWWFVIEPVPPRHRLRGGWSLAYIGAAKVLMGLLGLVLTFSPNAIYDTYEQAPRTWGLSAVEDLNVGGVLMMLEQSVVLVIFFGLMVARLLASAEQAEQRRERLEAESR
jgi:putative membrane protein